MTYQKFATCRIIEATKKTNRAFRIDQGRVNLCGHVQPHAAWLKASRELAAVWKEDGRGEQWPERAGKEAIIGSGTQAHSQSPREHHLG
jgi:hypothetical protein